MPPKINCNDSSYWLVWSREILFVILVSFQDIISLFSFSSFFFYPTPSFSFSSTWFFNFCHCVAFDRNDLMTMPKMDVQCTIESSDTWVILTSLMVSKISLYLLHIYFDGELTTYWDHAFMITLMVGWCLISQSIIKLLI